MSHHALRIVFMQSWTDPWSISLEVNRGRYDDGPGISQRAAAARSQRLWRWLVKKGINMKKKETTWEDVIGWAVKKKITPEEFTQILIDGHEEVGMDKKQLQVLKKTLGEMDEQ